MILARLFMLLALSTVVGAVYGWTQAQRRRARGQPILDYASREAVPWGAIDLAIAFGLLVTSQIVAAVVTSEATGGGFLKPAAEVSPETSGTWMLSFGVSSLVAWALTLVAIRMRTKARWVDLGVATNEPWSGVRTGVLGFAMLAVPVFAVQAVLKQFYPIEHPLIEMLMENPSPSFFVMGAFAAVIVAPITEEFLFRVILQGWMENVFSAISLAKKHGATPPGFVASYFWGLPRLMSPPLRPTEFDPRLDDEIVMARPVSADREPADTSPSIVDSSPAPVRDTQLRLLPSWGPILISSGLFAGAHVGHGPDPIPLFLLAMGLGYVYQRTHYVLPCIMIHCLLNGVTMFVLWLTITGQLN